jgi:hypothetical protein
MQRWGVERAEELLEAIAPSPAGSRFSIPACVGMTRHGACRGAKPLCVVCHSPFSKGGHRGIGLGMRWRWAQPTLRWIRAPRASLAPLLSAIGARKGGMRATA